jgi:hypothetical protein
MRQITYAAIWLGLAGFWYLIYHPIGIGVLIVGVFMAVGSLFAWLERRANQRSMVNHQVFKESKRETRVEHYHKTKGTKQ